MTHAKRDALRRAGSQLAGTASLLVLMAVSSTAFAQEDPWADVRAIDAAAALQGAAGRGAGLPAVRATQRPTSAPARQRLALPATAPLPPARPVPYEDVTPTVASASPADTSLAHAQHAPTSVGEAPLADPPSAATIPGEPLQTVAPLADATTADAGPDAPASAGTDAASAPLVPPAEPALPAPVTVAAARPSEPAPAATTLSWEILGAPLNSLFPPAFAAPAMPEPERSPTGPTVGPAPQQVAMGTLTGIFTGSEEPASEPAHGDAKADGDAKGEGEAATKAEAPPPPPPPIFRDLRQLQRLQDRMALGEPNALDEQNALLMALDLQFRSVDVSAWKDPANARALVLYLLSGGSPKTVRTVLANGADPAVDPRLVRGALAYVEGREADAVKDLGEIDARSLPASLGGQVALAQAALWVRKDQARAALLLDQARVLAPGTLVEEGALRRAILIAAQANDLDTFERLTATYLGRFRHSVYAGNFRQRFAAALTRMSFIDNADEFHRLDGVLRPIEPEGRRDILLIIAQGAVVQGKTAAAIMAADRVLKAAPVGSLDSQRATLYRGAAMAASSTEYEAAGRQLRAVSRDRLANADLALLDTALSVVNTIEQAGLVTLAAVDASAPAPAAGEAAPATDDSTMVGKARNLLGSTEKLLAEAPL
jgi:chemotaxis protein MotC